MTSRLAQMQARFQQKQMQEKEEKLLRLYENQQQRTIERVSRGSAGSDGSVTTISSSPQGGKVRQMFDERRQKAGIDRSYPLEPLKTTTRSNGLLKPANRNVVKPQPLKVKTSQVENYRYEDSNANDILHGDKRDDLVSMMNDHNLNNESLDDEQFPNLGIDEVDEPAFTGKLANVGGKLPSQNDRKIGGRNTKILTTTFKKDTKPTVVKKTKSSPKPSSPAGSGQSPKASAPTTPSKSVMSSKKPSPPSNRTSSTQRRPSVKAAFKGPHTASVTRDDLEACQFCNRRFAADRLQVHEEICARTAKKKRKAYDALKHRVQGTELEPFVRKTKGGPKIAASQPEVIITVSKSKQGRPASAAKKSNWRQTHDDFISTIRAAKIAQQHVAKGGKLSDLPPPPPSSNPDYIQCPHCGRRFNQGAAERHIPKCADFQFNKPKNGPKAVGVKNKGSYR